MRRVAVVLVLFLLIAGCCHLEPTVKALRNTIESQREDYEKGRVTFSTTASVNSRMLAAKLERLMEAENNIAVALKEKKPFPDVRAAVKSLVYPSPKASEEEAKDE